MIGRVDPEHENMDEYIYIIGSDHLSHDLHTINEEVNKLYTGLKLDYKYNDTEDPNRFYYRSDHYNFAKHNIPIIFYFNGTHKDYHQPTDTIEKIRFDLLKKRSDLVFYCAWELANREQRIRLND
jgi:Zn-dependent M28 family amino/carboxypeptidase